MPQKIFCKKYKLILGSGGQWLNKMNTDHAREQ